MGKTMTVCNKLAGILFAIDKCSAESENKSVRRSQKCTSLFNSLIYFLQAFLRGFSIEI